MSDQRGRDGIVIETETHTHFLSLQVGFTKKLTKGKVSNPGENEQQPAVIQLGNVTNQAGAICWGTRQTERRKKGQQAGEGLFFW